MNEKTEQELLSAFASQQSETCFAELVRRHVDLVYSAAVRLAGDPVMAEDVSQAVFIALAHNARTVARKLTRGTPLSGWLHLTTRNIAAKMIRTEARRRAREREATLMSEFSGDDTHAVWDQIVPYLDRALGELPAADRDALLLRFFERKSAREIGLRLGLSEEAAQKRLTRALGRLHERFVARGVSASSLVSGTSLVLALESHAVQSAPATLAGILTKAALAASAATAPGIGAVSIKLISSLAMTKSQALILASAVVAIAIPVGLQQSKLTGLRTAVGNVPASGLRQQMATPQTEPHDGNGSFDGEIKRLTLLRDDLRERLRNRRDAQSKNFLLTGMVPGPTLLEAGRRVSLTDLKYAGNATPEAALQSSIAFARDGDLAKLFQLALVPPGDVEKINEVLASPQQAEQLKQEMAEELQGVVQESSVLIGPDNKTEVGGSEGKKLPDNPAGTVTFEIEGKQQIDEHRVDLLVKVIRGSDIRTETTTVGLTSSGWKLIVKL